MSDAFADVAKMKNIKEAIKSHEGQLVELTLENGRKREKNKNWSIDRSLSIMLLLNIKTSVLKQELFNNSYVESYTYSDIFD